MLSCAWDFVRRDFVLWDFVMWDVSCGIFSCGFCPGFGVNYNCISGRAVISLHTRSGQPFASYIHANFIAFLC